MSKRKKMVIYGVVHKPAKFLRKKAIIIEVIKMDKK